MTMPKKCPRCGKPPVAGVSNTRGVCPECWCTRCHDRAAPNDRPAWVQPDGYLGKDEDGQPMFDEEIYQPVPGCGTLTGLCLTCLALTCPDCQQAYGKVSGHCRGGRWGGCCRSFASSGGFDQHRSKGRCLTDAEMAAAGWRQDDRGWWRVPEAFTNANQVFA